jgi:hypothetical protein
VSLVTLKVAAGAPPNWTLIAPVKYLPVIVTEVVPVLGPVFERELAGSLAASVVRLGPLRP